eukprot:7047922-Pyramimonas_sp.AAC.1
MAAHPALCSSACSPASLITSSPLGLISGRVRGDTVLVSGHEDSGHVAKATSGPRARLIC